MVRILLNGAGGRMGSVIRELVDNTADCEIAGAIDAVADGFLADLNDFTGEADIIIDFSHHSATAALTAYAVKKNLPLIVCTTGQTEEEKQMILDASAKIPVFFSANMSLGIAVLLEIAKKAVSLFPDADVEIVEAHHNRKIDAPSGTANMLLDGVMEVRPDAKPVYGRSGMCKREKNEIGMHSLRIGNEPGMHEVIIATDYQTLTLKHNAESRAVFADGALAAARFLVGKEPGLYDMKSMTA